MKRNGVAFSGDMEWASNFYSAPIIFDGKINNLEEIYPQFDFDGLEYPTSEHLFQSLKTTNASERNFIRLSPTPGQSKKNGKTVFLRTDWESVKVDAMRVTLYLKFYQNPYLLEKLLKTENESLVEMNYWNDTFWGIYIKTGKGKNWLGRLLMELRANLKLLWQFEV